MGSARAGSNPVADGNFIEIQIAAIAQLGERQTEDLKVPGSIPGGGSLITHAPVLLVSVAQWITHPSPKGKIAGSNPVRDTINITFNITSARLAQMVERMTLNHVVAGSIPAVGAILTTIS